jgi:hypothetical protein
MVDDLCISAQFKPLRGLIDPIAGAGCVEELVRRRDHGDY